MNSNAKGHDMPDDVNAGNARKRGHDGVASPQRALRERAEQLGATAEELEAALDQLALQAEVVLHRLRGGSLH